MKDLIEQLIQQRRTLIVEICDYEYAVEKSSDRLNIIQQQIMHIDELIVKIYDCADLVTTEKSKV